MPSAGGLFTFGPPALATALAFVGIACILAGALLRRRQGNAHLPLSPAKQKTLGGAMFLGSVPAGVVALAWTTFFANSRTAGSFIDSFLIATAALGNPVSAFVVFGPLLASALCALCGAAYVVSALAPPPSPGAEPPPPSP